MEKPRLATSQLSALIMDEIRKHQECAHVILVGFTRPTQMDARDPNWAPAFTCDGPKAAPAVAFEIARRFQNQYDLL